LTTVSQRFQKKEILESFLFPSQVISDQYASKSVLRTDGRRSGARAPQTHGSLTVLQSRRRQGAIAKDEIDAIRRSKIFDARRVANRLTLEEIADLFAYLNRSPELNPVPEAKGRARRYGGRDKAGARSKSRACRATRAL